MSYQFLIFHLLVLWPSLVFWSVILADILAMTSASLLDFGVCLLYVLKNTFLSVNPVFCFDYYLSRHNLLMEQPLKPWPGRISKNIPSCRSSDTGLWRSQYYHYPMMTNNTWHTVPGRNTMNLGFSIPIKKIFLQYKLFCHHIWYSLLLIFFFYLSLLGFQLEILLHSKWKAQHGLWKLVWNSVYKSHFEI